MTELHCRFCGDKCQHVRQVPAPVPISDCYCNKPECVEACEDIYGAVYNEYARHHEQENSDDGVSYLFDKDENGNWVATPDADPPRRVV